MLTFVDARYHCTSCGDCCRSNWDVPLCEGEAQRFEEIMAPLIPAERLTRAVTPDRLRLQGAICPALTPEALCLVHAAHGAAAKPRVCQIFPYHFVETPTSVRVGVSFACPGVLDRQGPRLDEPRAEVEALYASAVAGSPLVKRVPEGIPLDDRHVLPWPDAELLLDDMAAVLAQDRPLVERVARAGALATLVVLGLDKGRPFERARAAALAGAQLLSQRILAEPAQPDSVSRTLLRGLVHSTTTGKGALERMTSAMASLVGKGTVRLRDGTRATFTAAASVSADLDEASLQLLGAWLHATVQGLRFFGESAFGLSILAGFELLTISAASAILVARVYAASDRRAVITIEDVRRAIYQIDAGVYHRLEVSKRFLDLLQGTNGLALLREQLHVERPAALEAAG